MTASPPLNLAGALLYANPVRYWAQTTITYGFPTPGSSDRVSQFGYTGEANDPGYAALNAAQQARFTAAIAAWDRLISPNFIQVTNDIANVRVAFTNYPQTRDVWGYTYVPPVDGVSGSSRSGDIWISADYRTAAFEAGGYDYMATLHEIGHAIALSHPHESPGYDTAWDSTNFTVMSYNEDNHIHRFFQSTGSGLAARFTLVFSSTPMVVDIAAVQQRYGADSATAAGDDVYVFAENTPFYQTIYDAGGIDTIDLSGHARGSVLNLTPGVYSDVARFTVSEQIAAAVAQHGGASTQFVTSWLSGADTYTWTNNLGIAFSTTIENARGGAGNDDFTGNAASNRLEGGAGVDRLLGLEGDDFLIGGAGNDILDGGGGQDVAVFALASSQATWTQTASGWTVTADALGSDALSGVELLRFTDRDVSLAAAGPATNGTNGNDQLTGGPGDDQLNGLFGDDAILGAAGADRIDGGAGVDTAIFRGGRSTYTITRTEAGATVSGPDGTDTLVNVEWLKFDDQAVHYRPGTGTSVNFGADPSTYAGALRDFDGNDLGGTSGWRLVGQADIQNDGDMEYLYVNRGLGRWATIGPAEDGLIYFGDHSWAGDTRVVGIYIDPLVQTGQVAQGGPFDSQRRFANDLAIGNISKVLGAGDYDKDGLQEVYFALSDGSAYLHAYMHSDGNIRYANYQSQQQVTDFLSANGFSSNTWAGWFG